MRLAACLPVMSADGPPTARATAEWARTLEDLGYTGLWTFDAVGRGFMLPDPLQALTVAAGATEQVELVTGVLQLAIRRGRETGHRALSLAGMSGGRLLLGVGPGSTAADFEAFGGTFADRFDTFDHELAELRDVLTGDRLTPWPAVVGTVPVALAGWRGGWIERAAREGATWLASGVHADDAQLAEGLARYRAAGGTRACVTNVQIGDDPGPAVDRLRHLAELGFDDASILDLRASPERFAMIKESFG